MFLDAATLQFSTSAFPPLALGFMGLGTGYLIYGPRELLGWLTRDKVSVDYPMGVWGLWLPGSCSSSLGCCSS